jgi:hypothetical protein
MNFRIVNVSLMLFLLTGCIGYFSWHTKIKYRLPLLFLLHYTSLIVGKKVESNVVCEYRNNLLHLLFFYSYCPCSRFNPKHIRKIILTQYDCIKVLIGVSFSYDIKSAKKKFGCVYQIVSDSTGQLAKACFVYFTPQAAIIDRKIKLFFRTKYYRARYCTSHTTYDAAMTLLTVLNGAATPVFNTQAAHSYSCELFLTL